PLLRADRLRPGVLEHRQRPHHHDQRALRPRPHLVRQREAAQALHPAWVDAHPPHQVREDAVKTETIRATLGDLRKAIESIYEHNKDDPEFDVHLTGLLLIDRGD